MAVLVLSFSDFSVNERREGSCVEGTVTTLTGTTGEGRRRRGLLVISDSFMVGISDGLAGVGEGRVAVEGRAEGGRG